MTTIYTDGGCRPNPGNGAWAAVVFLDDDMHELSGTESSTTSNRMEMTALIKALEFLSSPSEGTVYTDSNYVVNAIRNQVAWKRKLNLPNQDLVVKLYELWNQHNFTIEWVRGHDVNTYNNRCDDLVNEAFWRQNVSGNSSTQISSDQIKLRKILPVCEGT